jgi:uncharacterized membrane protein
MGDWWYWLGAGSSVAGTAVAAGASVVGSAVGSAVGLLQAVASIDNTINILNSRNSRFFITKPPSSLLSEIGKWVALPYYVFVWYTSFLKLNLNQLQRHSC